MSNVAANLLSHASTTNGSMTTTQRTLNSRPGTSELAERFNLGLASFIENKLPRLTKLLQHIIYNLQLNSYFEDYSYIPSVC